MNEVVDPYRPPAVTIEEAPASVPLEVAGRGRRFCTYVVDSLVLWVLNTVALIALMVVRGNFDPNALGLGLQLAVNLSLMLGYYIVMEGMFARTIGKFACGTTVVDAKGAPPTWGQVVGRSFARFIPFEFLAIFGANRLMLHDTLPDTRVVCVR
jgi:uncharacterized RDD family membrane protein YckC